MKPTIELSCLVCGDVFEHPIQRGRKPSKCPIHRAPQRQETSASTQKPLTPKERVDRLEMQLKAEGKHISQHRKEYE